jgi:hypothetical protein
MTLEQVAAGLNCARRVALSTQIDPDQRISPQNRNKTPQTVF